MATENPHEERELLNFLGAQPENVQTETEQSSGTVPAPGAAPDAPESEPSRARGKLAPLLAQLKNGLLTENPTFVQLLGMCPTLAVTTSVSNGIGMGLAATAVLIMSNFVISLLRKVIPSKVRIASYVTIIAGFVTMIDLLFGDRRLVRARDDDDPASGRLSGARVPDRPCAVYHAEKGG